jgi:hypothetical protein
MAAASVLNGVPRELTRRGDNFRLIDEVETELDRPLPNGLPDSNNVFCGLDGSLFAKQDRHPGVAP